MTWLYHRRAVEPDLELINAALGSRPRSLEPVGGRGYTQSATWRAETADGVAFVKQAEEAGSLEMLRSETLVHSSVSGPFLPAYTGSADSGERAVLAIEFLTDALWPPPYPDDVSSLFVTLERVAATPPPPGLWAQKPWASRWERVAADPEPLLALTVCSREWLERSLGVLIAAESLAVFEGDDLSHSDVYCDNVCFTERGPVLVDWGSARRASRWVDIAFAVLSVREEGGVLPTLDFPDEAAFAAALAGHFAVEAPAPLPAWARRGSTLREDMAGDLAHALRWAVETLELPPLR